MKKAIERNEILDMITEEIYDNNGVEKEEDSTALVIDQQLRCSEFEGAINKAITLARQGYRLRI